MTAKNLIEILEACAHNTGTTLDKLEVMVDNGWGYTTIKDYGVDEDQVYDENFDEITPIGTFFVHLNTYGG